MAFRSLALSVVLLLAFAGSALAEVPAGPRLAVSTLGSSGSRLYTVDPQGEQPQTILARGSRGLPVVWSDAAWSPDGTRLVIAGVTSLKPRDGGFPKRLFLLSAEGGKPEPLKGTVGGLRPVFSPDGHSVAFAREKLDLGPSPEADFAYASASIWITDLDTGKTRQLTPWRNRLRQYPSSFAPDGSVLAFTRYAGDKPPEAIGINFDGSAASVLVRGSAIEPVFTPDGTRIAFVRGPTREVVRREKTAHGSTTTRWHARLADLYTVRAGGGDLRRLTKTPRVDESEPSWDPSGQRLAFVVTHPLESQVASAGEGAAIRVSNADGSCAVDLLGPQRGMLYGPSWQPGAGRGAGPLSC